MKLLIILLILALLHLLAVYVTAQPAQRKTITAQDFREINSKANLWLTKTPYRITKTTDTDKTTEEYVPPDKSHIRSEYRVDGKSWKMEWISLGDKVFERKNAGRWKRSPDRYGDPIGMADDVISKQYFSDGNILIDGKNVEVIVVVVKVKSRAINLDLISTSTKTYWYDSDGRRLRILYEMQVGDKENTRIVGTDAYEYDSNIKIEAPIK